MDVTLIASSFGIAVFLPFPTSTTVISRTTTAYSQNTSLANVTSSRSGPLPWNCGKDERNVRKDALTVLRTAMFISLCLFSMSLLEAAPNSWSFFLYNDNHELDKFHLRQNNNKVLAMPLSVAYRFVLWADCLLIAVVAPAMAGSVFLSSVIGGNRVSDRAAVSNWTIGNGDAAAAVTVSSRESGRKEQLRVVKLIVLVAAGLKTVVFLISKTLRNVPIQMICTRKQLLVGKKRDSGSSVLPQNHNSNSAMQDLPCSVSIHQMGLLLGSLLGIALSMLTANIIGNFALPTTRTQPIDATLKFQQHQQYFLEITVTKLCAIGVLISTIMDGFGSVSMPYSFLSGMYFDPMAENAMTKLNQDYQVAVQALNEKREVFSNMLSNRKRNSTAQMILNDTAHGRQTRRLLDISWFRRRCSVKGRTSDRNKSTGIYQQSAAATSSNETALQDEVYFLEELTADLHDEIVQAMGIQRTAIAARTGTGRLRIMLGRGFSAVLVFRIMFASWNLFVQNDSSLQQPMNADPITSFVLWSIGHNLVDQQQYDSLSQCISLILTGFLSTSQIRSFLLVFSILSRKFSSCCYHRRRGYHGVAREDTACKIRVESRAEIFVYLAASMMGCYFLSCVTMMKMNLPSKYRYSFISALGDVNFEFDTRVRFALFTMSAFVSVVTLGCLLNIKMQVSRRHNRMLELEGIVHDLKLNVLL